VTIRYQPLDVELVANLHTSGRLLICEDSATGDLDLVEPEPWDSCDEPVDRIGLQVRPGRWCAFRDRGEFERLLLVHDTVDQSHARMFEAAETIGALIVEGGSVAVVDAGSRDDPRIVNELRNVDTGETELFGRAVRTHTGGDGVFLVSIVRDVRSGDVVAVDIGSRRLDTRWITKPPQRLFELLERWTYAVRLHPDDEWPASIRDLLGFVDASALTGLVDEVDEVGDQVSTRRPPVLSIVDALPSAGPIPGEAIAFADALVARTEQPDMHVAWINSPSDDGVQVMFLCAGFEVERLRRAGHLVELGT